jgi:hypothetical protein
LGLLLALAGCLAAVVVSVRVFERVPHIEDEVAYLWQARLIADDARLTMSSPPRPGSFLIPFVVDYNGLRFGKYPLGWPVALAVGVRLGAEWLVNPLLAGLGVWLTYRLGQRLFGVRTGWLAAGLTATSPFFLMNSGSLLSHPLGLFLSAAFVLAWLDTLEPARDRQRWLAAVTAGLTLGLLALTRPLTAAGVALPFVLHGAYRFLRGPWALRRRMLLVALLAACLGALHFVWQYAVTGDPLLNPYTLWWSYDQVGFGPGYGHAEGGHNLEHAWVNTRDSLGNGVLDLFGWGVLSWLFLPFGLWAARRNRPALLVGSIFPILVLVYLAYWIGSSLFGPRYYYEGLYSLTLFSAAGIVWLAGWERTPDPARPVTPRQKIRPLVVTGLLTALVSFNLFFYTPLRVGGMYGLYGIRRSDLAPFQTEEALARTPALVFVHSEQWMFYGGLTYLEDPALSTPFIFAWSNTPSSDEKTAAAFPDRHSYHYYPDEPGRFYPAPK